MSPYVAQEKLAIEQTLIEAAMLGVLSHRSEPQNAELLLYDVA